VRDPPVRVQVDLLSWRQVRPPLGGAADDSEQASYIDGKLQVCARSAACARSTQWLMPAGPAYKTVNPIPPERTASLPGVLAELNSYSTGCADVAGDCTSPGRAAWRRPVYPPFHPVAPV
jgi:hypothetical protein